MGRALYDARRMQPQAICLLALLGAGALATAQTPPAPGAPPAVSGPQFVGSEEAPRLKGFGEAYSLSEVRIGGKAMTEEEQLVRWQTELAAGRARAGAIAGAFVSYRALTPQDCAQARDLLTKADELGNDQAAWLMAQLTANPTCGAVDRPTLEKWLRKAVVQDYPGSAVDLIHLYADSEVHADQVQKYLYARVAAGYWEATKTAGSREGFDEPALLEMEKTLSAGERSGAEAEAAKILAQMLKRHERFVEVNPVEFAKGDAGAKASFVAFQMDYRHECVWNLKNNCRGAQRLAFVDLTNKNADFSGCRIEMRSKDFVNGSTLSDPLLRQVLVGPGATRRLLLGDVYDQPDKNALSVRCTPVPKLKENALAGRCRAKLQGSIDVERYYPESARNRGLEGSVVVRFWVPPGSELATDGEIATSSGDASLDSAAITTVLSGRFSRDCEYGLSSIRIAFKLQQE
jgi:TonB family protein